MGCSCLKKTKQKKTKPDNIRKNNTETKEIKQKLFEKLESNQAIHLLCTSSYAVHVGSNSGDCWWNPKV